MGNIEFYEINEDYVNYLIPYAPHLFHNKQKGQANERKYIGIVFEIHGMDYFAPLSSFKAKHQKMKESLDFLKVQNYAVINLNNMFPVPASERIYVNFNAVKDSRYKSLLLAEYRYIKSIQGKSEKMLRPFTATSWQRVTALRLQKGVTTLPYWKPCVQSTRHNLNYAA